MSYLCLKRDIPEGGYEVVEGFSGSYLVQKKQGKISIAKNECPHRGFRLADCGGKGAIKCKYHGQRFEFQSVLSHREFGEFLFLPEYLGESKALGELSKGIGDQFGEYRQSVKAPFHLWIQNTMDPNHLTTAHKDSFSKLFEGTRPESVYLSEFESSYTMRIKDEVVERYEGHFGALSSGDFYHYMGFPNVSVTSFLGVFYSIESVVHKPGAGCVVNTRFFKKAGETSKKSDLLARVALEANIKILQEDKALVEKWAETHKPKKEVKWMQGEERIRRYQDELFARELV